MPRNWKAPRKILCAVDLTPDCDRALDRAILLAATWQASLLVVHVVHDANLGAEDCASQVRRAEQELKRELASHPGAAKIDADVMITQGDPAARILAKCDRLFVDLLVMGAGAAASLRQRLLGSTIDHVLRHALQPVLCVRDRAHLPYRKIAVATDFSVPSAEALACAQAYFPGTATTLVHAYDDRLQGLLASDQVTGELAERHKVEMQSFADRSMQEFVAALPDFRAGLKAVIEAGAPDRVLQGYIEREGTELVVVGTHGRTGLGRAIIGSVAEHLIAALPCDVLAVRSSA